MGIRKELKNLHKELTVHRSIIQSKTEIYIKDLEGSRGIYITDHAIRRYLERVKGVIFNKELTDEEYINSISIPPEYIREEMLTLEEDRKILRGQRSIYYRGVYRYIIKELSIITVLLEV